MAVTAVDNRLAVIEDRLLNGRSQQKNRLYEEAILLIDNSIEESDESDSASTKLHSRLLLVLGWRRTIENGPQHEIDGLLIALLRRVKQTVPTIDTENFRTEIRKRIPQGSPILLEFG